MAVNEKALVIAFANASKNVDDIEEQLKTAKAKRDKAEATLIEWLEANDATTSAKYDGIGYARMMKPRLYAQCTKENETQMFDWLRSIERNDMIKESVSGLNSFVSELIENGTQPPEFVSYYLKQTVRIYDK